MSTVQAHTPTTPVIDTRYILTAFWPKFTDDPREGNGARRVDCAGFDAVSIRPVFRALIEATFHELQHDPTSHVSENDMRRVSRLIDAWNGRDPLDVSLGVWHHRIEIIEDRHI